MGQTLLSAARGWEPEGWTPLNRHPGKRDLLGVSE